MGASCVSLSKSYLSAQIANRCDSYTKEQMEAVTVAHRNAESMSDYIALGTLRTMRWGFDLFSGYRHDKEFAQGQKDVSAAKASLMTPRKWLVRYAHERT